MTAIGDALSAARGTRSIREAARAIGINHTQLSRYEHGTSLPTIPVLHKIARYYQLDWPASLVLLGRDHATEVERKGEQYRRRKNADTAQGKEEE